MHGCVTAQPAAPPSAGQPVNVGQEQEGQSSSTGCVLGAAPVVKCCGGSSGSLGVKWVVLTISTHPKAPPQPGPCVTWAPHPAFPLFKPPVGRGTLRSPSSSATFEGLFLHTGISLWVTLCEVRPLALMLKGSKCFSEVTVSHPALAGGYSRCWRGSPAALGPRCSSLGFSAQSGDPHGERAGILCCLLSLSEAEPFLKVLERSLKLGKEWLAQEGRDSPLLLPIARW